MSYKIARTMTVICLSINLYACGLPYWENEESRQNPEALSELQIKEREKLVAGGSLRPKLSALHMQPVRTPQTPTAKLPKEVIPRLSLLEKKKEYNDLLSLVVDEEQKKQIRFRLADIEMLLAEQTIEQGSSQSGKPVFDDAIASYLNILNHHQVVQAAPGQALSEDQQALNIKLMDAMYQLSRALDLAGERQQSVDAAKEFIASFHPSSFAVTNRHVELWFRIGEHYFSKQEYAKAINYYQEVLAFPSYTEFYRISAYMLGWSYFKLDEYDNALIGFNRLLAHSLPKSKLSDIANLAELEMSKGALRLVEDSLRVMAMTFSYKGSASAIASFYQQQGEQAYQHLVYDELAQQYLDDNRYSDSAEVLLAFAQAWPEHPRAVPFFVRHIDAFILGEYPAKVLAAKQAFVAQYGLGNGVVENVYSPIGQQALPFLKQYLPELAQTEHSFAQYFESVLAKRANSTSKSARIATDFHGSFASTKTMSVASVQQMSDSALVQAKNDAYQSAVLYYQSFVASVENEADMRAELAQTRFYMAEALFALNDYSEAIQAFDTYAYIDQVNPMAAEAAYASLIAWQRIEEQGLENHLSNESNGQLNLPSSSIYTSLQQAQIRFVQHFISDTRAINIGVMLMQSLHASKHYREAIGWADWVLNELTTEHDITSEQQESAFLVSAHSHYAVQQYARAEHFYTQVLSGLSAEDTRYLSLTEALGASMFKQAEAELLAAQMGSEAIAELDFAVPNLSVASELALRAALAHLERVLSLPSFVTIRELAQFDSATYHALLGNWEQAIALWKDFAQSYPEHALTERIEPQLLFAYEQLEDWEAVATILLAQYFEDKTSENAKSQLFSAAEYFEKANNRDMALDTYRRFAHAFADSLPEANEARYKLSEFYLASKEDSKRRYWLNKMMQAQMKLVNANPTLSPHSVGTSRSRYLAAMSAMVFAEDAYHAYKEIKLSVPLNKSLAKKQKALSNTTAAFDRVMSFAVAEFTTQANYRLALVYATLAEDLMDSERPKNMSALEASQYDILLEEQAYPFEETAIEIHEANLSRVKSGIYDQYVQASLRALSDALPVRYNKPEQIHDVREDDL
ncbi:tetratricopeptide repeat protein [Agaribacter flavus]|uniref:Tol-pal system YbgF family protein n=1 Tax=Agaribacter flavus TaxID=1902781 RepID=A0ABV7FQ42_9ALTE